jgi:hypothetical protein
MQNDRPILDILLATWEGGGNVPPVLGAARHLVARGHRVRVMADAVIGPAVVQAGAEFRAWRRAPNRVDLSPDSDPMRDWEAGSDIGGFMALRDKIMCGPALAYAQDVLDELIRRPADLILSSEMLMGVMVASEAAGVPLGLLCPNVSLFPLPGLPPMGMGLRPATNPAEQAEHARIASDFLALLNEGLPSVNAARAAVGLRPLHDLADQVATASRILLATSPAFDFKPAFLPPRFCYVGPLLMEPVWAQQQAAVSLSTRPIR